MKSNLHAKLLTVLCATPSIALAQDAWQLKSSAIAMAGHYVDSQTMNNQQGLGLRMSGEKNQQWGFTAGLQSTRINMNAFMPQSTQNQDNWLLSGFIHTPSARWPGRWTFQLDTHQVNNDASQNSSDVRAVAPQVTWLSYSQPLKVDFSYASSNYKNTAGIHQLSTSIAYGFNNATDWLQIRSYAINNLDPSSALGQSNTRAIDTKLTHILGSYNPLLPTTITLGLERGKKIYVVDMTSQTLYNLPMLNEGGENITASWRLNPKTQLDIQLSKTRYFADASVAFTAHHFTLDTLSLQLSTAW